MAWRAGAENALPTGFVSLSECRRCGAQDCHADDDESFHVQPLPYQFEMRYLRSAAMAKMTRRRSRNPKRPMAHPIPPHVHHVTHHANILSALAMVESQYLRSPSQVQLPQLSVNRGGGTKLVIRVFRARDIDLRRRPWGRYLSHLAGSHDGGFHGMGNPLAAHSRLHLIRTGPSGRLT
jgi:hypothetical protein